MSTWIPQDDLSNPPGYQSIVSTSASRLRLTLIFPPLAGHPPITKGVGGSQAREQSESYPAHHGDRVNDVSTIQAAHVGVVMSRWVYCILWPTIVNWFRLLGSPCRYCDPVIFPGQKAFACSRCVDVPVIIEADTLWGPPESHLYCRYLINKIPFSTGCKLDDSILWMMLCNLSVSLIMHQFQFLINISG